MPYVNKQSRERIGQGHMPATPGELNYKLTDLVDGYMVGFGGLSYSVVNEVIGVLECMKLELYRRVAAPYEDKKLADNGDVYSNYG